MSDYKTVTLDLCKDGAASSIESVVDDALELAYQEGVDSVENELEDLRVEVEDLQNEVQDLRDEIKGLT
jgi:polyhydroxyalkanoate synthesis regulator phasin